MAATVTLLPALGVCSMGGRCLSALPWGLQGCPGAPSPGPTERGSWLRLSPKPLALTDPISQGPGAAAGQQACGGCWRWAAASDSLLPSARLQDRQGVQRGGGGSVVWGRWPRSGPGSASSPPSGKWSSRDPHHTVPGGAAVKQWAAPRGLEPPLFLKATLAGRHDASEQGKRGGQGKCRPSLLPLPPHRPLRWGPQPWLSSYLCPASLTGTACRYLLSALDMPQDSEVPN